MVNKLLEDEYRKFLTLTLVLPMLLFSASLLLSYYSCNHSTITPHTNLTDETQEDSNKLMEIVTSSNLPPGVKIEKNPSESKLTQLGVSSWPKWEGGPIKIPWTFNTKETMYLLEGKVNVYTEGYDGFFEIGAGDLVEFPKGMKITWDVIEAVNKHYYLEK